MTDDTKKKRRRTMQLVAAAGALLGILCHMLPHDYQAACGAVIKATTIAIGGC